MDQIIHRARPTAVRAFRRNTFALALAITALSSLAAAPARAQGLLPGLTLLFPRAELVARAGVKQDPHQPNLAVFTLVVRNVGLRNSGPFVSELRHGNVNGLSIRQLVPMNIPAGGSQSISIPAQVGYGAYFAQIYADLNEQVPEHNEQNNGAGVGISPTH